MATTSGRIRAISVSQQKGTAKANVPQADLQADYGIVGDAHAGAGLRQVSLLAAEALEELRGRDMEVQPGDFAENITTEDLDMSKLKVGNRIRIAGDVELEVTQLGKRCHQRCGVYDRLGECIMPRQGVFARVCTAGRIRVGDNIEVMDDQSRHTDGQ